MCMLGDDIYEYNTVAQGKITIPGVDDGEEFLLTDVSTWNASYSSEGCIFGDSTIRTNWVEKAVAEISFGTGATNFPSSLCSTAAL